MAGKGAWRLQTQQVLTVDPPEDVEGGPLVHVGGQGVPQQPHPQSGTFSLQNQEPAVTVAPGAPAGGCQVRLPG